MSNTSLLGSFGGQAGTALTFKNRLINGDMKISQRFGTGNAAITAGTVNYITDRWVVFCATAGATCSQVSATVAGHTKALRVLPAAGNTYTEIVQRVEAVNIEDLASSVVTFSGWVYVDNATGVTANVVAYVAASVDSYSPTAPTAITITNPGITLSSGSYVYVEKQITLPANATNGIQIGVSFTGVASKDVRLTGASLEAGPTATPFERRPIGVELSMCQRYGFDAIGASKLGNYARLGHGGMVRNTTTSSIMVIPPVTLRAGPSSLSQSGSTVLVYGATGVVVNSYAVDFGASSSQLVVMNVGHNSGPAVGAAVFVECNNTQAATLFISAEL